MPETPNVQSNPNPPVPIITGEGAYAAAVARDNTDRNEDFIRTVQFAIRDIRKKETAETPNADLIAKKKERLERLKAMTLDEFTTYIAGRRRKNYAY